MLRDRQHLAEDGILIVVLTLERGTNQLLAGPDIVSRGFVYVRESEGLMEEARHILETFRKLCVSLRIMGTPASSASCSTASINGLSGRSSEWRLLWMYKNVGKGT